MAKYDFEDKNAFTVVGIGVELTSDYMDQAGLDKEKEDFFNQAYTDGTVDNLRKIAKNDFLFAVNLADDDKMMHYVGVESDEDYPEATRMIHFPEGKYIVIPAEANSPYELADKLTNLAFGEVLNEEQEYAYVGGPNAAVIMGETDGVFVGEMWIPVVKQ